MTAKWNPAQAAPSLVGKTGADKVFGLDLPLPSVGESITAE